MGGGATCCCGYRGAVAGAVWVIVRLDTGTVGCSAGPDGRGACGTGPEGRGGMGAGAEE